MIKVRIIEDRTDDLILHQTGEEVEAQRTRVIEIDGRRVQIDLTEDNSALLDKVTAPFMEAGYPPPQDQVRRPARHIPGTTALGRSRTRNLAIRLYAAEIGRPVKMGADNKPYIPVATKQAFEALPPDEQDQWINRALAEGPSRRKQGS